MKFQRGKKYLIQFGASYYSVTCNKATLDGKYGRCRFGPFFVFGEWLETHHILAEL